MGDPGQLLDRQGVHVRPQADHLPARRPALDDAHHAGAADAGHDFIAAEAAELVGHDLCGAVNLELEFRIFVEIAPPDGRFSGEFGDTVADLHGSSL